MSSAHVCPGLPSRAVCSRPEPGPCPRGRAREGPSRAGVLWGSEEHGGCRGEDWRLPRAQLRRPAVLPGAPHPPQSEVTDAPGVVGLINVLLFPI